MKKIVIIILFLMMVSGCSLKLKSEEELKKSIIYNIEKISHRATKNSSYDYVNNKYFRKIIKNGYDVVPIMLQMYYDDEFNEVGKYVAAFAIQEVTDCNIFEIYGLIWDHPDEFFEIWKNNNCYGMQDSMNENFNALLEKYSDFSKVVKECKINLPIFHNMIPQGITEMGKYYLITAYDSMEENNSQVYVLDKEGKIFNIVNLDTNSHVGGIEYDKYNDFVWIPGNKGKLNVYNGKDFLTNKEVKSIFKIENMSEGLVNYQNKGKNQIAYLSVIENRLYIGSFSLFKKGLVKEYKITNENNNLELIFNRSFSVPSKVQGITFYKKSDIYFMILSRSYGRHNSSYLNVFEFDENIEDYTSSDIIKLSLKLPPMLEQVSMKSELYSIFESNAKKYNNCLEKIGNICILNVEDLIESFIVQKNIKEEELAKKEKEADRLKDKAKKSKGKK